MLDDYQVPAAALVTALLLAFGYLDHHFRSPRIRLWMLAMLCVEVHSLFFWRVSNSHSTILPWAFSGDLSPASPWMAVVAEVALMVSSALFLASLSPLTFRIGKMRIMYVVPYTIPLILYSVLVYSFGRVPGHLFWVYVGLAVWVLIAGMAWSISRGTLPIWLSCLIVSVAAICSLPFYLYGNVYWPLRVVQSGNMLMTALLVIYTFRRLTPGVLLTSLGFLAWSLPPFFGLESNSGLSILAISLARAMILGKVVVAIGLILIVVEDEIAKNQLARHRERRVRLELEAYARQALTARNLEEFDRESGKICAAIVQHSRFTRAALLARTNQDSFTLIGAAGMDGATVAALDALAQRLVPEAFNLNGPRIATDSNTLDLDLTPATAAAAAVRVCARIRWRDNVAAQQKNSFSMILQLVHQMTLKRQLRLLARW